MQFPLSAHRRVRAVVHFVLCGLWCLPLLDSAPALLAMQCCASRPPQLTDELLHRLRGGAVGPPEEGPRSAFESKEARLRKHHDVEKPLSMLRHGVAKAPIQPSESQMRRFDALLANSSVARGSLLDESELQAQAQVAEHAFSAADNAFLQAVGTLNPQMRDQMKAKLVKNGGNRTQCWEELLAEYGEDEEEAPEGMEEWQAMMDRMPFVAQWQQGGESAPPPSREQVKFWEAAEEGDVAELERLAGSGQVAVDLPDPRHYARSTALLRAAMMGHAPAMRALVRLGADGRQRDRQGESALHAAARQQSVGAVECAVRELGVEVEARNCFGQTPLMAALDWEGRMCARKHGEAGRGEREAGLAGVVGLLVEAGADPRGKDETGWTPAHYAARWGRAPLLRLLLQAGADPHAQTSDRHTPLDWAEEAPDGGAAAAVLRAAGGQRTLGEGESVWDRHGRDSSDDDDDGESGGGGGGGGAGRLRELEGSSSSGEEEGGGEGGESADAAMPPLPPQRAGWGARLLGFRKGRAKEEGKGAPKKGRAGPETAEVAEGPERKGGAGAGEEESGAVVGEMLSRLDARLALRLAELSDDTADDSEPLSSHSL